LRAVRRAPQRGVGHKTSKRERGLIGAPINCQRQQLLARNLRLFQLEENQGKAMKGEIPQSTLLAFLI